MPSRPKQRSSPSMDAWGHRVAVTESSWPLRFVDAGFFGLILILPFIWGGRQALGTLATVLLSGWTAFWWAIHQLRQDRPRWRFSGAEPLFLLAVLLVALQTISIPESLKDGLSPQIDRLLPAWGDNPETSIGLGRWSSLSFAPWQTWSDLVTLVSVMLVFFIAVQRLQTVHDIHRIMRYLAVSGFVTAIFGITQYLVGNGKFFWFYEHPDTTTLTSAKGGFTNANHFADFLAMSLPAQLWWHVIASRNLNKLREARNLDHPAPTGWRAVVQEYVPALMLGLTSVAIVLSQSRGGLLVTTVGMAITCSLFWKQKLLDSRVALWLLGIAVFGLAAALAFGSRLDKELSANIASLQAGQGRQVDRDGSRQKIWATDSKVLRDFPIVGTGLGTHRYVYQSYHDYPDDGTEYTHAENGYLQVAMETGLTGIAIAILLIGLVCYWCVRGLLHATSVDIKAPFAVAISVLMINLVHSCTDFVWYVPGCMVIVVLAAASACVLYQLSIPQASRTESLGHGFGRMGWGLMLVLVVAGLGWGMQVKWPELAAEPHYHEYKRLVNSRDASEAQSSSTFEIAMILQAAKANPHDPILQVRAARAEIRSFLLAHDKDHDLRMEDIRQAAISSNYPNRKALHVWLDNPEVMGENRRHLHRAQAACLRAMRLCPLEPRPYIESAKLAWLSLAPPELEDRLMLQALASHPFDGQVQLEYAHALNNRGETDQAIAHYQKAFERDLKCRAAIVVDLAPHYAPSFFLNTFELDRATLMNLRQAYAGTSDIRGYHKILTQLAKSELDASSRTSGETSSSHIVAAHGCYAEMGNIELATTTLQKAIKRQGNSYNLRSNLANWLFDHERYSDALPHLEWCHRRRPDIKTITHRIETAQVKADQLTQMAEDPNSRSRVR